MCAMLACVASQELRIQSWRLVQFVESYVGAFKKFIDCLEKKANTHLNLQTSWFVGACTRLLPMSGNIPFRQKCDRLRRCKLPSILPVESAVNQLYNRLG